MALAMNMQAHLGGSGSRKGAVPHLGHVARGAAELSLFPLKELSVTVVNVASPNIPASTSTWGGGVVLSRKMSLNAMCLVSAPLGAQAKA